MERELLNSHESYTSLYAAGVPQDPNPPLQAPAWSAPWSIPGPVQALSQSTTVWCTRPYQGPRKARCWTPQQTAHQFAWQKQDRSRHRLICAYRSSDLRWSDLRIPEPFSTLVIVVYVPRQFIVFMSPRLQHLWASQCTILALAFSSYFLPSYDFMTFNIR